jgi:hypothetical protein
MTATVSDVPPAFGPLSTAELVSVDASKITNVSVYVGRAEITRVYTLNVKKGQNMVHIKGLPDAMDRQSLRCVISSLLVDSCLNRCVESKDVGMLPSTTLPYPISQTRMSPRLKPTRSWKMNPNV